MKIKIFDIIYLIKIILCQNNYLLQLEQLILML